MAGHAWLLPLIRRHVRGSQLAHFSSTILPLAKRMTALAASSKAAGRSAQASRAAQLEYQLWATLPALASFPRDAKAAFGSIARELGEHLASRADLRGILCTALKQLVGDALAVIDGQSEGVPPGYTAEVRHTRR